MAHLIDKDALVAEIDRMIKHYNESAKEFGEEGYNDNVLMEQCKANACEHILSSLNTLEVKEVDLEPVENPICAYSTSRYTDEDRKVLCEGCEEDCEYNKIEEPVSRTPADIEAAMQEVEEKSRAFTEAHQGEDADTILAQMRGEEPVSKVWHDSNKEQPEYGSDVVVLQGYEGDVLHRVVKVNPDRIWAYTNDLLNLTLPDSSEREEEPVSEELENELDSYIKANFTIDKEQLDRFGVKEKDYIYSMDKSDMKEMVRYFTGNYKIPVSNDLDEAAKLCVSDYLCITGEEDWNDAAVDALNIFKAGAKWQKEHLWKPADGDDLPEIDREVIAFQEIFPTDVDVPSLLKVVIAHRPNLEGYDGKSITTGQTEHYTPKTYDKGGWNIPSVKYWLNLDLPQEGGKDE